MQIEMEKEGNRCTVKGSNGSGGLHGRETERELERDRREWNWKKQCTERDQQNKDGLSEREEKSSG